MTSKSRLKRLENKRQAVEPVTFRVGIIFHEEGYVLCNGEKIPLDVWNAENKNTISVPDNRRETVNLHINPPDTIQLNWGD